MKDFLTTLSSIVVILFGLSVLFLTDKTDAEPVKQSQTVKQTEAIPELSNTAPQKRKMIFLKVQGVNVKNGVLHFVTLESYGLKDHFISLRGKNVILSQSPTSQLPVQSIQFEENGPHSLRISISTTLDFNLQEKLAEL